MPSIDALWSHLSYLPYLLLIPLAQLLFRVVKQIKFTYDTHTNPCFSSIPSLPRHWLLGNLHNAGPLLDPSLNRHPDYGFEEIWHKLDKPPALLVDLTPVDFAFLVVIHPSVAEAIAQPSQIYKYSVPKSDTLHAMHRLIGWESLIMAENDEWRNLRRRLNKGFAPQHLHSLSPLIMSKARVFINRLKSAAANNSVFLLKDFAQDLTTDIITELAIEKDFHSQTTLEGQGEKSSLGVLTASRILSALVFKQGQGFDPLGWIDPIRPTRSWFYEKVFDWRLYNLVSKRLKAQSDSKTKSRSITALALDGMEPTPALIRNTVSQLKSFLFAGQDTTATLIQWICYELSKASHSRRHAKFLAKLEDEHDRIFGDHSPWSALEALSDPHLSESTLGDKLPYTTAWVKETLRLHPPAGTARYVPQVSSTTPPFEIDLPIYNPATNSTKTQPTRLNGLRIYICQYLLHRNKSVWGEDAHEFNPERWLDEKKMNALPAGAWRPFERGPRNCIGQTLALMEGVMVLGCVARGVEWVKVGNRGDGGDRDAAYGGEQANGDTVKEKEGAEAGKERKRRSSGVWRQDQNREVWAVNQVTSVPVDGMKMRVKLRVNE